MPRSKGPGRRGRGGVTIRDVARAAGVSVATVSRHLNATARIDPAKRRRIDRAVRALSYHPHSGARSLARGRPEAVGLAAPLGTRAYADLFLAEIVSGATEAAAERGWSVLLIPVRAGAGPFAPRLLDRVSGTILLDIAAHAAPWAEIRRRRHPVVVANAARPGGVSVEVDNAAGGRLAADHVLRLGHRRVGIVASALPPGPARLEGARRRLLAAGVRPCVVTVDGFSPTGARRAAQTLLSADRPPTVLLFPSDWMAIAGIDEARRRGLHVPDDLSIVGFDDAIVAETSSPPLTTIRQPLAAVGRAAVERLAALADGRRAASVRLPVSLVERESCAGPPPEAPSATVRPSTATAGAAPRA